MVLAAVAAVVGIAKPAPGHTPFHVGCKNHNHGPKWHADHGRAVGTPASRYSRPDRDMEEP